MLVLTRKIEQSITIGDDCEVKVLGVLDGKVKLGITAPRELKVNRKEAGSASPKDSYVSRRIPKLRKLTGMTETQARHQAEAEWKAKNG